MHEFRKEMTHAFEFAHYDAEEEDLVVPPAKPPLADQATPGPAAAPAPIYQPENFEPTKIVDFSNNDHDIPQPAMESFHQALAEFEPYVLRPEPKQPTNIHLKPNERFELPHQSHDYVIKGDGKNHISIKSWGEAISIDISHGNIHIHEHCSNLTIDAGNNSTIKIDYDCSNIKIHGFELDYTIHKECKNISVNGMVVRD